MLGVNDRSDMTQKAQRAAATANGRPSALQIFQAVEDELAAAFNRSQKLADVINGPGIDGPTVGLGEVRPAPGNLVATVSQARDVLSAINENLRRACEGLGIE